MSYWYFWSRSLDMGERGALFFAISMEIPEKMRSLFQGTIGHGERERSQNPPIDLPSLSKAFEWFVHHEWDPCRQQEASGKKSRWFRVGWFAETVMEKKPYRQVAVPLRFPSLRYEREDPFFMKRGQRYTHCGWGKVSPALGMCLRRMDDRNDPCCHAIAVSPIPLFLIGWIAIKIPNLKYTTFPTCYSFLWGDATYTWVRAWPGIHRSRIHHHRIQELEGYSHPEHFVL